MDRAELILGTAGHIDHGKTALVRALTGVDTDRLPEEKARGITIELGFAPLELPGGRRLSVIDVPGHERLVRTMIAGATGIDLLLLVVAADEGVMPQTREHLAICELLGLQRAVVALTKVDTVDADIAELARDEVALLLEATPLAGSPIVPTSSLTGEGIDTLRDALVTLAEGTDPRTPRSGPARLPIDRCFEMRGFGSVVTGTLVGAGISVGDTVEIHPSGTKARVRGIQCHGESVERGEPGARCALNLQGVSLDELGRGRVVSHPSTLPVTNTLDVQLQWLRSAPPAEGPTSVVLLSATSERLARVAPIGEEEIAPGSRGFARVHVEGEPVSVLPGDRFVLRGFARTELGATLGGGSVLDVAPPHRRRSDPALFRDLTALAAGDPVANLAVRVERSGLAGVTTRALRLETGLDTDTFDNALDGLLAEGRLARAGDLCLCRSP